MFTIPTPETLNCIKMKFRPTHEIEANLVLLKATRNRCTDDAERKENSQCIKYIESYLAFRKEMDEADEECTCDPTGLREDEACPACKKNGNKSEEIPFMEER